MDKNAVKKVAEDYARRVWEEKDLQAIDDLIHPDAVIHSLLGNFEGRQSMKTVVESWLKGFPDLKVKNSAVICENDLVVMQWHGQGTHKGEFKGLKATGKPVSYAGVTIYRIKEHGKHSETNR